MDFSFNEKTREYQERVTAFMDKHIYPNEKRFHDEVNSGDRWAPVAFLEELKPLAREAGLWKPFPARFASWRRAQEQRICTAR